MDDNQFEDLFRSKLQGYEDPEYDHSAVAAFNEKLSALSSPWYVRYRTALLVAATMLLFTFINYHIVDRINTSDEWGSQVAEFQEEIIRLQKELKSMEFRAPDTIYVSAVTASTETSGSIYSDQYITQLINNQEAMRRLIEELIKQAQARDNIMEKDGTYPVLATIRDLTLEGSDLEVPALFFFLEQHPEDLPERSDQKKYPRKVLRDLRKHYSKGVGIKVGGQLDLVAGSPSVGNIQSTWRSGILGELVLSPSLGIETGVKYSKRKLDFTQSEIDVAQFPDINASIGQFTDAVISSNVLEIPLHLKYYYPLKQDRQLYVSGGITPQVYLSQQATYNYLLPESGEGQENEAPRQFSSTISHGQNMQLLGTYDFGIGISQDFSERQILQAGAFVQRSFNGLGRENIPQTLYGLKIAYQFRLR